MTADKQQPSKSARPWPGVLLVLLLVVALTAAGFLWPDPSVAEQVDQTIVEPTAGETAASPTSAALAAVETPTDTPQPPVTPTSTASPVPTASATSTPQPTATSTSTPIPATATSTALPTSTPAPEVTTATAGSTGAPTPWPTTNPDLLRLPPAGIDTSQSHLWFSRPLASRNAPSVPYRFGMTYDQRLIPHRGVDVGWVPGTEVLAVGPGTVFYAGEDLETIFGPRSDYYGRVVLVKMEWPWAGHTIYTLYGHLESVAVEIGQVVNAGDVLGGIGSAGVALGPHLHFEVRQDDPYSYGAVRNPELWYRPVGGYGVLAGRVIDAAGRFVPGTRVDVVCSDGKPRYVETYWDQYTRSDDVLAENFVISDLPAGRCTASSELFGTVVQQQVEIRPGELSVVILQASE